MITDWYEKRDELRCGMVFRTLGDDLVKLDYPVPGDGTKWRVANWSGNSWAYYEDTIEPGDLVGRVPDPAPGK